MTEQITLHDSDPRLYQRGLTVAHSSTGDGFADVGQSVGLGNGAMLYAGERPGHAGWCICIYRQKDTIDIAEDVDAESATDLLTFVAAAINAENAG